MRPSARRASFLLGALFIGCSVFPESAPSLGSSTGGKGGLSGGSGSGGAGGTGAPDSGGDTSTAAGGAEAGGRTSGGAENGGTAGGAATGGAATGGAAMGGATDGGRAGGGSGATSTDAGDARAPDAGDGGPATQTVSYVATIADCLEAITQPQQGACMSFSTLNDGPNELWVDIRRAQHRAFATYLAFPIGAAVLNRTIDAVELHMTVTTYANAAGSGADVWEVVPFTAKSIYTQVPARIGTAALALSPGAATKGQTVTYSLPTSVASANQTLYLELSISSPIGDGTGYFGISGNPTVQMPPTLVVRYH